MMDSGINIYMSLTLLIFNDFDEFYTSKYTLLI